MTGRLFFQGNVYSAHSSLFRAANAFGSNDNGKASTPQIELTDNDGVLLADNDGTQLVDNT